MTSLYLIAVFALLMAWQKTRKFALYFLPWLIFAVTYDSMRFYPNYMVGSIDVRGLYEAEKSLFGIAAQTPTEFQAIADHSQMMIPCEYFQCAPCSPARPYGRILLPLLGSCSSRLCALSVLEERISLVCALLMDIPCGQPHRLCRLLHSSSLTTTVCDGVWVLPILGTPGNVAGLARFDELVGYPVFHSIYCHNANVFAAVPSLHAAYMLITTFYAAKSHQHWFTTAAFAIICMGIWWTAVYSGHHYIIDVLLGIMTAIIGILLMEKVVFKRFLNRNSQEVH